MAGPGLAIGDGQAGSTRADLLAEGDSSYARAGRAANRLFESATPPSAIIASNDPDGAKATLETGRARGIDVPRTCR